jgi:hypothetical protein
MQGRAKEYFKVRGDILTTPKWWNTQPSVANYIVSSRSLIVVPVSDYHENLKELS